MSAWLWCLVIYLALCLLAALTDKDSRTVLIGLLIVPAMLPALFLAELNRRVPFRAYWRVPNRHVFAAVQRWWDEHPDVDLRLLRVGRVALMWTSKGTNAWRRDG